MKAPKKAPKGEMDEEDLAFKEKQRAGSFLAQIMNTPDWSSIDAKAKAELAAKAKGSKGPLNTGAQGIKKSGKK